MMPKPMNAAQNASHKVSPAPSIAPVISVDTLMELPIQMQAMDHHPRLSLSGM